MRPSREINRANSEIKSTIRELNRPSTEGGCSTHALSRVAPVVGRRRLCGKADEQGDGFAAEAGLYGGRPGGIVSYDRSSARSCERAHTRPVICAEPPIGAAYRPISAADKYLPQKSPPSIIGSNTPLRIRHRPFSLTAGNASSCSTTDLQHEVHNTED